MSERRVWIAQCLCPQRHAIAAMAGEADDKAEANAVLIPQLQGAIERLLAPDVGGNPWCGICGAERETWRIEVGRTRFRTIEEAEEPLADQQVRHMLTSAILGTHGPIKPGRA